MTMTPGLRKFALTIHITSSVGWIGAVIAYIGLVLATQSSPEEETVRAARIAMALIAWYVLVPLAFASLLTGLVMSLGTKWGLFRHYWVLISLVLTIIAIVVLLTQLEPIRLGAGETHNANSRGELLGQLLHPGGGLLVLLIIQTLNVYKPRGLTPYGWRKQHEQRTVSQLQTQ
jgi:hypothetical protein